MSKPWRGRANCGIEDCPFVIYIEGEPVEELLDTVITMAVDMHVAKNHPNTVLGSMTPVEVGMEIAVFPPKGAFEGDEEQDEETEVRPRLVN